MNRAPQIPTTDMKRIQRDMLPIVSSSSRDSGMRDIGSVIGSPVESCANIRRGRAAASTPLALLQENSHSPVEVQRETGDTPVTDERLDLPQGTLDLLILKSLSLGAQHGWAISERLHQVSRATLQVPQGS